MPYAVDSAVASSPAGRGPEGSCNSLGDPLGDPLGDALAAVLADGVALAARARGVALDLLRDGLALAEVAAALGLPARLVVYWLRREGLREPPQQRSVLPARDAALAALALGAVAEDIAARLGLRESTVRFWGREAGLALPPLVPESFDGVVQAALRALGAGFSALEVARRLGIDNTTVRTWARAARIRPARRAERATAEQVVPALRQRCRVSRSFTGDA